MSNEQLIIIGSGPAGLTAALYAARAGLNPLVIDGSEPGGQLMGTSTVENWPGEHSISGPLLMEKMRSHAEHFGTRFLSTTITSVDFSEPLLQVTTKQNKTITARAIIIATGATPKRLGCPGEKEYWGKGVTTCAVCDGTFYKNRPVVIVGGGDTAMEDASFMTNFTQDITIVHILDRLTASQAMQKRVLQNPAIKIIYNSTIDSIHGDNDHLTHIIVTNKQDNSTLQLPAHALFVAIGLQPNTQIFKNHITLDSYGYVTLTNNTQTSAPGVFAAGDVADFSYRQAITSSASGCMAALDAEKYLKKTVKSLQ